MTDDGSVPTGSATETAPVLAGLVVADEPESWRAAGFAVDDDGSCRVGSVRIRLVGRADGKRIRSWSFRGLDPTTLDDGSTIDGIATSVDDAPVEVDTVPVAHPNGVESIDHVVVISPDGARTVASFDRVGLSPRRTRTTDTYGAPFVQTFYRCGEVIVELIAPEERGEGPTGFFGLAYTVTDLDQTVALLGDGLGVVKDAVQPGRKIVTLHHRDFDMSVASAFMSPEP